MPTEPGAYAPSNGLQLWYRDEGDRAGDPLLLIMDLGGQLTAWPQDLVDDLTARGYRVIRFDNRDCGLSDKIEPAGPDGAAGLRAPYQLVDLAEDAVGLLDHLGIARAHVVGASMGGMIAQLVAIHHADRVRSLCSIMSTTGAPFVGMPTFEAVRAVLAPTPPGRDAAIEHIAEVMAVIGSRTLADEERSDRRAAARVAYDRMFYPQGVQRQFAAISEAADRTGGLTRLRMPTLVVHGDEDPFINVSGGVATHNVVPNSAFLRLETMGHDLPARLRPEIVEAVHANAREALVEA